MRRRVDGAVTPGATRAGALMTVGELASRTGLSIKAIRRYEALGLIRRP